MKYMFLAILVLSLILTGCSNYSEEPINNIQPTQEINTQQQTSTHEETTTIVEEKSEPVYVEYDEEEVLADTKPYLDAIITDNHDLRVLAAEISEGCSDDECRAVEIFDYVVMNYEYISDPRGVELIQSPHDTLEVGGGDCEDLTILYNSLLENVGIETKLVLTKDHAYSLVCGLDVESTNQYVADLLYDTTWDEYYNGIDYYIFDDMDCIVGDGANGYFLGDDSNIEKEEKIAIDPITLTIDFLN
ncbi:transglutaminase domain-containing protein [Candidatus Woesearchaeota archaeon]|nr:transglutaminase domain-containing protein [Candidatus Woesearchaeota archaeon]